MFFQIIWILKEFSGTTSVFFFSTPTACRWAALQHVSELRPRCSTAPSARACLQLNPVRTTVWTSWRAVWPIRLIWIQSGTCTSVRFFFFLHNQNSHTQSCCCLVISHHVNSLFFNTSVLEIALTRETMPLSRSNTHGISEILNAIFLCLSFQMLETKQLPNNPSNSPLSGPLFNAYRIIYIIKFCCLWFI